MTDEAMERSPHQQEFCPKCLIDSSSFNHCSWCGRDFGTDEELDQHLEEGCLDAMKRSLGIEE